jgi:hypothetical protein
VLFLLVTLLVVPENLCLSSPVRDSWESTGVIRKVVDKFVEVCSVGVGTDGKCDSPSGIGGEVGYCWECCLKKCCIQVGGWQGLWLQGNMRGKLGSSKSIQWN